MTKEEIDLIFLEYAPSITIDVVNGRLYNKDGKELSTGKNRNKSLSFCYKKGAYVICRARAIWVYVHGPVPNGMLVCHKSKDLLDDRLENLELLTLSERNKRSMTGNSLQTKKMTDEMVSEARRIVRDRQLSYSGIVELFQKKYEITVSKQTLMAAVKGITWTHLSEPPVDESRIIKKTIVERNQTNIRAVFTVDMVNEARRMAHTHTIAQIMSYMQQTYNVVISSSALGSAISGGSWKNASEPPVKHRHKTISKPVVKQVRKPVAKPAPEVKITKFVSIPSRPVSEPINTGYDVNSPEFRIAKSLLKNNSGMSSISINSFLKMRKIFLTDQQLKLLMFKVREVLKVEKENELEKMAS